MLSAQAFLVLQGFTRGLLLCDDLQGCIRRVAAGLLALRQPLADDRVGGLAVENQEGGAPACSATAAAADAC